MTPSGSMRPFSRKRSPIGFASPCLNRSMTMNSMVATIHRAWSDRVPTRLGVVGHLGLLDCAPRYWTTYNPIAMAISSRPANTIHQRGDATATTSTVEPAPLMKSPRRVSCVSLIDPTYSPDAQPVKLLHYQGGALLLPWRGNI